MHLYFVPEALRAGLSADVPYSPAFAGQVCFETAGIIVPEGGLETQIKAALRKAQSVVEAGEYTMNDVVRAEIWVVNMNGDTSLLNRLYLEFLDEVGVQFNLDAGIVYPARQAIGVSSLPHALALVEVVFKVAVSQNATLD
ncbi:RidA family protein [Patescibacteria group bacterium]|nr:RidA family protein [Patescibacteria group bacterium]MBU1952207.1 RidA family protein [Patescibacteria group bacterium]